MVRWNELSFRKHDITISIKSLNAIKGRKKWRPWKISYHRNKRNDRTWCFIVSTLYLNVNVLCISYDLKGILLSFFEKVLFVELNYPQFSAFFLSQSIEFLNVKGLNLLYQLIFDVLWQCFRYFCLVAFSFDILRMFEATSVYRSHCLAKKKNLALFTLFIYNIWDILLQLVI